MGAVQRRADERRAQVSVIVPALDEADRLPVLLADLAAQTRPPDEVLVVDGGSTDGTAELARAAGARVLVAAGGGVAVQRNEGAAAARGDLLVFVDADVRLGPTVLERLLTAMDRRRLDAACPLFWPYPGSPATRAFFIWLNWVFVLTTPVAPSGGSTLLAVRRPAFERAGGFDPRYRFEDAALIRRLGRRARYGIVLVTAFVSDRRFRRDGTVRTIAAYLLLGVLFSLGLGRAANLIGYRYGRYGSAAAPVPGRPAAGGP